ncbi:hypothetical protein [Flavobacterium sp.]|uniref:hypothetical protein n=1 Tax=Flavobacterium sp. TaxID=239 RepID=UPI0026021452|nr:hypothetical protein [Flavobacterium sp.]
MGISKKKELEYARILYVSERLTYKEVSERVGVTEKTISKWANLPEENWDKRRKSLLTTRQSQLVHWYNQLEAINEEIANRPPLIVKGKELANPLKNNIPTNSEADTMSKITSNIQKLEVEISLGEYVQVTKKILEFIQKVDLDAAKLLTRYADEFINSKLKNG